MITGALQADTAHIVVPAAGSFTIVMAIDNRKAGEIQGQRLDSSSRLIIFWGVKQICINRRISENRPVQRESTPRKHLATARWTALGAGSQQRHSRATSRRMMQVSLQWCSTAHESRDAKGRDPDLVRGRQACAFGHKHARYCRTGAGVRIASARTKHFQKRSCMPVPSSSPRRRLSRAMRAQRRDSAMPASRPW